MANLVRNRVLWRAWLGGLLFLAGEAFGLYLSGYIAWGETEARFRSNYYGDKTMPLECPLMIAPDETAVIHGTALNLTDKEIKPVIRYEFARKGIPQEQKETLILAPGEEIPLQWSTTASDEVLKRLILFNVRQSQYRDNPSRWGSCSIIVYSLFGMSGANSLAMLIGLDIAALLISGALWFKSVRPLNSLTIDIARIGGLTAGTTVFALLSTLPRWWGLTIFCIVLSLLAIGNAFIELVFTRKRSPENP